MPGHVERAYEKKHEIGSNCPQCNEYYLFEEHLEEHIEDQHI